MDERLKVYEEKMTKSYDSMMRDFTSIRAGRANPHVLDKIKVDYYVLASDLGITPTNDGSVIRLIFPELTEERRKELVKDIKKKGEAAKVAVRNIRRDANEAFKKLNKANEISEDDQKDLETKTQKMTDKYIADIDKAVEEKSKEILTV